MARERRNQLQVIKPGTKAMFGTIESTILAVTVDIDLMPSYQVEWWDGATRNIAWVSDKLLHVGAAKKIPIGFSV